jgi:hypothetical protein
MPQASNGAERCKSYRELSSAKQLLHRSIHLKLETLQGVDVLRKL